MRAPIVVFVYNRIDHVKNLMESLAKNPEAKESILYIFSDAAKDKSGEDKVDKVREFIDSVSATYEFKDVIITKAKENKGLAKSIIDGVSHVMAAHGCAIVIEDDNIVAEDFLDYMNRGLEFYKDDDKVWAISGFSRKMTFPKDYEHDIYMLQRLSSYTWASWNDRWDKTDWEVKDYPGFLWNVKKRRQFASYGKDRPYMLDAQMCGKISSWAIRFEYSMMKNNMYSILPCQSKAICNGNDGSGTHSDVADHTFDTELASELEATVFERVELDERIRKEFCKVYEISKVRKIFGNLDFILCYFKHRVYRTVNKK